MCNLLVEKDRKEMMLLLVFDLFTRMMYKIYIGTRRPRGQGLVYYLCHPTFAMTGALAWQRGPTPASNHGTILQFLTVTQSVEDGSVILSGRSTFVKTLCC